MRLITRLTIWVYISVAFLLLYLRFLENILPVWIVLIVSIGVFIIALKPEFKKARERKTRE